MNRLPDLARERENVNISVIPFVRRLHLMTYYMVTVVS